MEWYTYEMMVPWHECDPAGIAFHGNYIFWLERAFISFLYGKSNKIETKEPIGNVGLPVTHVNCRYLRPIPVWSNIKVCITVSPESDLRRLIMPFKIVLSKTDQTAAEGEIRRRFVEMGKFQTVECPRELREILGYPETTK